MQTSKMNNTIKSRILLICAAFLLNTQANAATNPQDAENPISNQTNSSSMSGDKLDLIYSCLANPSNNTIPNQKREFIYAYDIQSNHLGVNRNGDDTAKCSDITNPNFGLKSIILEKYPASKAKDFSILIKPNGLYFVCQHFLMGNDCAAPVANELNKDIENFKTDLHASLASKKSAENESEKRLLEAFKSHRNNLQIDTVAKVLNYTFGCAEEGCTDGTFYRLKSDQCIYAMATPSDMKSIEINLNEIDPKSIKIRKNQSSVLILSDGKAILQNHPGLAALRGAPDYDRVVRGWNLIYEKFCTGNAKAF